MSLAFAERMFNVIPGIVCTLKTKLPKEELVARLKKKTEREKLFRLEESKYYFEGEVSDSEFSLSEPVGWSYQYKPHAIGKIYDRGKERVIEVRISSGEIGQLSMLIGSMIMGVMFAGTVIKAVADQSFSQIVFVSPILVLFVVLTFSLRKYFYGKSVELKVTLLNLLEATCEQDASRNPDKPVS